MNIFWDIIIFIYLCGIKFALKYWEYKININKFEKNV